MYQIRIATDNDKKLWEQILSDCKAQEHFYSWNWRQIIASVFGHKPYYLILEQDSKALAICPLFLVKSMLFGNSLISCPYLNGGGIVSTKEEVVPFFLDHIAKLQNQLSCKYTELRYLNEMEDSVVKEKNLLVRSHKVSMQLKLQDDPEKLFASFPPKLRSQIRRPTKEGCTAITVKGHEVKTKQINDFYSVFSDNMKELGSPVYSKNLFTQTLKNFGKNSSLTLVFLNNKPVACGITIRSGNYIEIPWAASLRSKSKFAPNMLLYWEILKEACTSGGEIFDFGRSTKDAGTYKFKSQWGSIPKPLFWYYLPSEHEIPDINPRSQKFELMVALWKRMPLALTQLIGPLLTKSLP